MSGKQSKKVRREKRIPKKAVAGAAAALLCTAPIASEGGEFILSVFPHVSIPVVKFDDSLQTGFGGGLMLTYRPIQYINIFAEGDYKQYSFDTKQDIGNISVIGGKVGAGYHLPLNDRMGLDINAGVGYYSSSYEKGQGSQRKSTSVNGISVSGSLMFSYKINPVVGVFAGGGVEHYAYKDAKFITSADISPGLAINLTKAFSNKANVAMDNSSLKPVFPVFYSWYNENSFGTVEISNHEDASITDVTVSFYHPQYMGQPQTCGTTKMLKKGESMSVDLRAFFNEQMLNLNEKNDTMTSIIVEYKYLGAKRTATFPMIVPIYGRNNMSWEDDRCASAFVSSKDPAAMWFSKYVVSTIRDNVRSGLPTNIQYAMGIFEALDQFGINYVKDPTSAFEDNVGTASIDFLQFPYQTLMYRGGDCDDLSILVCSLFESIGIRTAFITIPGHIFMAFDSGFTVEQAKDYFISLDEFIVDGDTVWVPLEITLSDEGFNKAWHKGAWEWNVADRTGDAMLYRMEDSWQIYKPVNVPGATARFTLPEEQYVAKLFNHSVDEFVFDQITPKIAYYENRIAAAPTAANYNDLGVLYARYGLFELAEDNFRIARSMKYTPAILNTANLYYSIKDYDRATNWYNEVLSKDSSILLAKLGLARCAYEKGDYAACDEYYGEVYNTDRALAKKYAYLGAFEETSGRSFSLADRLENTVWVTSVENSGSDNSSQAATTQLAAQTTDVVVKQPTPEPASELLEDQPAVVAVAPANPEEETEKEELEEDSLEGGDGDDDKEYQGITSELDLNLSILSIEELVALAETQIENTAAASAVVAAEGAVVEPVETTAELAESESELAEPETAIAEAETEEEEITLPFVEDLKPTETEIAQADEEFDLVAEETVAVAEPEHAVAVAEAEPAIAEAEPVQESSVADLWVEPEDDNSLAETDTVIAKDDKALAEADTTFADVDNIFAEAETESAVAEAEPVIHADDSVIPVLDTGIRTGEEIAEATTNEAAEADTTFDEADTELAAADTAIAEADIPADDLAAAPETSTTSLLTDVPVRAVPRFTAQPSEEWAPKEAYEVESIPGMKSFDEEMGNYQNEKAFLYKEEYAFAVNPGEELKKDDDDTAKNAVLEVNPFTSYLSGKEAEKMEKITNFKLEDVVETMTEVISSTDASSIPEPEVIPDAAIATSEETAVADQTSAVTVIEPGETTAALTSSTPNSKSSKTKFALIAGAAGIAAAAAALLIVKRRKEK